MPHVDDGTLHAYLDGELSPPETQGVERHLALCAACRTRLEEERALIARATELLGRAAPPDREPRPFRPESVKPPVRLWWQVRLPLAWAATIALALGIGVYLGPTFEGSRSPAPAAHADSERAVPVQPQPTPVVRDVARRAPRSTRHDTATVPSARQPAAPTIVVDGARLEDARAANEPTASSPPVETRVQAVPERENARVAMKSAYASGAIGGVAINVDSARRILGTDPRIVPDLPIRGMYRTRLIGYSAVVVVEQALDSSTVIQVVNGRPGPLALGEVVVTGAGEARPESANAGARALLGRTADSVAPAPRRQAAPAAAPSGDRAAEDLLLEVRGPVSADSLAALRRRLRPLRP